MEDNTEIAKVLRRLNKATELTNALVSLQADSAGPRKIEETISHIDEAKSVLKTIHKAITSPEKKPQGNWRNCWRCGKDWYDKGDRTGFLSDRCPSCEDLYCSTLS